MKAAVVVLALGLLLPLPAMAAEEPCEAMRSLCGPQPDWVVRCVEGEVVETFSAATSQHPPAQGMVCLPGAATELVARWTDGSLEFVAKVENGWLRKSHGSGVEYFQGVQALRQPYGECIARMDRLSGDACVGGVMCASRPGPPPLGGAAAALVGLVVGLVASRRWLR